MNQHQLHLPFVKKRKDNAGFFDSVGWRAVIERLISPIGKPSTDPATLFRGRVVSRTSRLAPVRDQSGEGHDHGFARGRWACQPKHARERRWEVLIP